MKLRLLPPPSIILQLRGLASLPTRVLVLGEFRLRVLPLNRADRPGRILLNGDFLRFFKVLDSSGVVVELDESSDSLLVAGAESQISGPSPLRLESSLLIISVKKDGLRVGDGGRRGCPEPGVLW